MHVHIIYYNYLRPDGSGMSIGGIQTYLSNLIPVFRDCGFDVTVYQRSTEAFHKDLGGYDVFGVPHEKNHCRQTAAALLDAALPHIDMEHDLLLYGCETCVTRAVPCRTIAIQHGISWDVPHFYGCPKWRYLKHYIGKCRRAWMVCQRVAKVDQLVCVDHNFVNWYRAIVPHPKVRPTVIPNFSAIPSERPQKDNEVLQIMFARRFFVHRGTRLFADVAERLLQKYPHIHITVAGEGPDAGYMHGKLDSYANVSFITYSSEESLQLHRDKDIAVVPTIGSEGTSLSLLEAMVSGCATVCTNVGGMTNIVLDRYNGLMISPDEESLYEALESLIVDEELRKRLQTKAFETVKETFSLDLWKRRWMRVIHSSGNL